MIITDIINNIGQLLFYIVYGFVCIASYKFVTHQSYIIDSEYRLIPCVVVSFILKLFLDPIVTLVVAEVSLWYYGIYLIVAIVVGAVASRIWHSRWLNDALLKIGFRRTTNQHVWDDLVQEETWLNVYLKGQDIVISGCHDLSEPNTTTPILVLSCYQILSKSDFSIISDYRDNPSRTIVVNTADAEYIEVIDVSKHK